jgi:hypothetical protein
LDKNRYHLLGSGFYAELEKYIRKISKTAALVFKGVHFPYIDPRDETDDIGNYGYVHFFTRKVLFDDCHFYTLWSKEDFPTNYVSSKITSF